MIKNLTRKIKTKLITKNESVIYNLGYDGSNKKRVLVSYLVDFLCKPKGSFDFTTNRTECSILINELVAQDYVVDVTYCNHNDEIINEYDMVIGFGEAFRNAKLKKNGVKVLYLTEAHPILSSINEEERVKNYNKKYNKKRILERTGTYYVNEDFINPKVLVCMGEKHASYLMSLYPEKKIYYLYPTGIKPTTNFLAENPSSRDFLWFGSRGAIHKGLDILVDVFIANPQLNLHVAGIDKQEMKKLFSTLPANVKSYGRLNINSETFRYLNETCQYTVLPSASEGVPTGVISCMQRGMIPIISDYCGTNFNGYAVKIDNINNSQDVEKIILDASSNEFSIEYRTEISKYALDKFSSKEFKLSWLYIIKKLK